MARDFVGENMSIREYLAKFGTKPRSIRRLPRLEIFTKGKCDAKNTEFVFTPEMAQNLADTINQYNCDIEEVSFVGDGLPSYEHAGKCIYPLRMTGKIMRMKIRLTPTEKVDLKPYELLFDAIDLVDDGTKKHLIEKYAGKSCYRIDCNNRDLADDSTIPRMMENEVLVYSAKDRQATEEQGTHIKRWTLDDFFQNLDEILTEIGETKT